MTIKVHHLNALAGTRELFMFLDIINDPEKYKKLLEGIEKQRDELNEKIELIGKVDQIDTLKSHAVRVVNEANSLLENAKNEAIEVKESAKERLYKKEKTLDDREKVLGEKEKEFSIHVTQKNNELNSLEVSLDEREKSLTERESEASLLSERAKQSLAETDRKNAIFRNTAKAIG